MRTGVLLMAHGTPTSLEEMPEYLTLVRGGRPPSPELVAEMQHNYGAIGGHSPLTEITGAQAQALASKLGDAVPVAIGMRNWHPFIARALEDLAAAGARRVIGIPMAPQFSTLSVQKYIDVARASAPTGIEFEAVHSFYAHPLLLDAFAERLRAAQPAPGELIVFTAHSLPRRVIDSGDRYVDEVAATARGVVERCGVSGYELAFLSAGRTPEAWLGPGVETLIRERSAAGTNRFLIVPIGFVCDHTEILYDIDVRAASTARESGATLRRTESLNTSPTFIAALEDIVRRML